jgi:metal-responsive CopG/Arc/MetJ family transcriptional regulator
MNDVETVVVLPEDLRDALDRRAPGSAERSGLVAAALRAYFAWPQPGEDAADLGIINAHADELNAEADDALSYQVPL